MNKFRKGQVVRCTNNVVLVTGAGDKESGYDSFSGVVLMQVKNVDYSWPVGMYSKSWSSDAFHVIKINLSKMIENSINL